MIKNKKTNIQLIKRTAINWLFSRKFFNKYLVIEDSLGELPLDFVKQQSKNLLKLSK